jgi:hypothetical protein
VERLPLKVSTIDSNSDIGLSDRSDAHRRTGNESIAPAHSREQEERL